MAFLAGPALFAIVGGIIAPGAAFSTLGAAIGWTVGAWLFGPKQSGNDIFDPGAQEMPAINQALRGVTMPVFFGTNRLVSNIVWTKNFTTTRKESTTGSGGKSGGSGGGMKGGGGPTNVSYEYKWDMMFHVGMAPQHTSLYGGWVNANKMASTTVVAIARGEGNDGLLVDPKPGDDIGLSFEDSYFGQAYGAGTIAQEPWAYFSTQEGASVRWPNTTYVGFQKLDLGGSPNVPQFSWEIGPAGATYTANATKTGEGNSGQETIDGLMGGESTILAANGKRYMILPKTGTTGPYIFACITDSTYLSIAQADLNAIMNASGMVDITWSPGNFHTYGFIPIANSDRFYISSFFQDSLNNWFIAVKCEINSLGAIVAVAGSPGLRLGSGPGATVSSPHEILGTGVMEQGNSTNDILVLMAGGGSGGKIRVMRMPGYADMTQVVDNSASALDSATWSFHLTDLECSPTPNAGLQSSSTKRGFPLLMQHCAFFLPKATQGIVGLKWTTLLYIYKPHWEVSNPSDSNTFFDTQAALYPNGYLIEYEIDSNFGSISSPVVNNSIFFGADDLPITFPFTDDIQNLTGSANDTRDTGYQGPAVQKLASYNFVWLTLWGKSYAGSSTNYPSNEVHSTIKAFAWSPFDQRLKSYGSNSGTFASFSDPLQGDATGENIRQVHAYFNETNSNIQCMAEYSLEGVSSGTNGSFINGRFADFTIGGQVDVTPAYCVYEILTNTVFGLGVSASAIDGYSDAVAYCEANDIFISVNYNRESSALQVIEELLSLFNCFLVVSGGRVRFGLQDVSLAPVRTIDNDHFVVDDGKPPVVAIKTARQDSFNKVRVNYFDRALAYRQNTIEVSDEVDMDLNGIRMREFPPKFVMKEKLANQIAIRALWSNLYSRDSYSFALGPKDQDLEPGDCITLVDSFQPELSNGVRVRIGRVKQSGIAKWDVMAVRELDYAVSASLPAFGVTSASARGSLYGDIGPPIDFRAYETPNEFQLAQQEIFFGYNPSQRTMGARLLVSPDGVTYGTVADIQPFNVNGIFADALPARPAGYMEQNVVIYLSPTSGFVSSSPTYCQTYDLDDTTESGREAGTGILIAGSEALAMEGITLLAQNKYRVARLYRGWGGTRPHDHSSGAYWHKHGGGVMAIDVVPDKIGTQFWYKVQPYNFAGAAYNIASIPAKTWTIKDWGITPQAIGDLQVFANSATQGQSVSIPSETYRGVASGGCNVIAQWPRASRTTGFGAGGYGAGAGGYGRFTADATTPSYRIEVLSGTSVVRSTSVNTEAFTYSLSINSADFTGWKGDFQIRVTPYNGYGANPLATVHTLHLF